MIKPARVLIVDDDAAFRRLLHVVLSVAGLEVVGEAGDGVAALDAAQRLEPDLVLMDYNMPEMNGLEAARRMAQSPGCPTILILTSDNSNELCVAARRLGVYEVLSKGISIDKLEQAVLAASRVPSGTLARTV